MWSRSSLRGNQIWPFQRKHPVYRMVHGQYFSGELAQTFFLSLAARSVPSLEPLEFERELLSSISQRWLGKPECTEIRKKNKCFLAKPFYFC